MKKVIDVGFETWVLALSSLPHPLLRLNSYTIELWKRTLFDKTKKEAAESSNALWTFAQETAHALLTIGWESSEAISSFAFFFLQHDAQKCCTLNFIFGSPMLSIVFWTFFVRFIGWESSEAISSFAFFSFNTMLKNVSLWMLFLGCPYQYYFEHFLWDLLDGKALKPILLLPFFQYDAQKCYFLGVINIFFIFFVIFLVYGKALKPFLLLLFSLQHDAQQCFTLNVIQGYFQVAYFPRK